MERGSARWRIAETRGAGESAFGLTVGLTNVQRAYKLGREKEAASGFRTADSERGREREREGKKWREMKQFRTKTAARAARRRCFGSEFNAHRAQNPQGKGMSKFLCVRKFRKIDWFN